MPAEPERVWLVRLRHYCGSEPTTTDLGPYDRLLAEWVIADIGVDPYMSHDPTNVGAHDHRVLSAQIVHLASAP